MKILTINCGSSSIKYQLLDMDADQLLVSGLVERIGEAQGSLCAKNHPGSVRETVIESKLPIPTHREGMHLLIGLLKDPKKGVIRDESEISGIGHRVVHGGENFHAPTPVSPEALKAIEANIPLAPLHNPANLTGIRVAQEIFPMVPQVVVFDTAFHQSIPEKAFMYALPMDMYTELKVRRYGFHGTSHKYVAAKAAKILGKPLEQTNLITVHLGNGCSMTAVENGKSVDTSLGMTPLAGLVMGTRCGDLDPAIHTYLARERGMSIEEIDSMLNKESGLKGICGMNDMRDIHAGIAEDDANAGLALEMAAYRNKKYIGSYMAVLGRVDAIVFTAGIGENDDIVREMSLQGLEPLGIKIDRQKNKGRAKEPRAIHAGDSDIEVWVIPTNEELEIARQTRDVLEDMESIDQAVQDAV